MKPRDPRRWLLPLLAVASIARADDDAGTRSVFAAGAGNRALALGSAYSALADDASALLWNPGGLGDAGRRELQVSQAELNDLGFRETFVGFVYPDWRWGATALALRQYGVGGIDGRDERNLPTGELSDRESELVLGYGRAMSAAWSVGVAARVRRQDLAGRSGTGLGADVGLKLRPGIVLGANSGWLQDVQIGLALANAAEPSIRLEQEAVADPATIRFGVSLARPLVLGGFAGAIEVEKPRDLGARLHAGVELRPHPLLALRTGLDGSTMTAGAEVRVGVASVDYAYSELPTGASHRAGLTWRFGHTVVEERAAAEREAEDRVQARLATLERERQAERVATLLAGATAAHEAGREDEALEALSTLAAIDSTNAPARALRFVALAGRARALEQLESWTEASITWARALAVAPGDTSATAGLARTRAEGDAKAARSDEIRRAFSAALDAFAADDLPSARAGLAGILSRRPGDSEAQAMLRRVDAALHRRTQGLLQQADALIRAGSLADAALAIDAARRLDPRAFGLAAASGALARAEQTRAAERARSAPSRQVPSVTAAPVALTREQERQLAETYRRGLEALERGQTDDALRALEHVRALRPGYARVDEVVKREYLTRGMELFSSGRLDAAIQMWERALQIDPHDARALGYLARANEQLARAREISEDGP